MEAVRATNKAWHLSETSRPEPNSAGSRQPAALVRGPMVARRKELSRSTSERQFHSRPKSLTSISLSTNMGTDRVDADSVVST